MASSIFGIGVSALNAAQAGMVTTQHNIANATTTGFHRQQIVQVTGIPQLTGYGFLGQGVQIDTVKRIYSEFLDNQVVSAQTQASHLDSYEAQIKQIDNMLADANSGLSPALQDFFSGIQDVATNPASVPSRQAMLSGSQALVSRFQALNQRFAEIRNGVNSQITSSVTVINSYAQQIAGLNQSIVLAQSATTAGQPPNDLLDQRDALIAQLNEEIRATVVKQSDGSFNVFVGNGQAVVVGQQAFALRATPSSEDPERMDVGYVSGNTTVAISPANLRGGNLGGLLAFRSESLDPAQNALGRVALGLTETFNEQHRLGQDLNGALGGDFFTAAALKQPLSNLSNTGNATLSATLDDVSALTTSDYRLDYDGANYTLLRLSDTATLYSGAALPVTVDGFVLALASGAAVAGDSFLIQPTRNGALNMGVAISDTSKIAAAAPIRSSAALTNTGSGLISAGSVTSTANLPLPADVVLTYSSGTNEFAVTGAVPAVANISYTSGSVISFNGISFDISGVPADGDAFTISANTGGISDNRNALLLVGLQTQNTMAGGTATYQGIYSQLVSQMGNKTREVQVAAKAQNNLVTQTKQASESLSGVNLDEEAANLIRYQQAYQAAGKAMQIATTLFDTLLSIGN